MKLTPLIALIFFSVSGGAYGIEKLFSTSGPGMGLLLLVATPLIYGIPHALVCAELGTAIPVEGGHYHWVRRGLGKFWGFQQGVLSWVCSFVDMAVYPVLFTSYLQSMVASVAPGKHVLFSIGAIRIDLNWMICLAVIATFTLLNLMGAAWIGGSSVVFAVICLTPMLLLTVVGLAHLATDGVSPVAPLTSAPDQSAWNAFGAGLFIAMWNYSGWDAVSTVAGEMENPRAHLPRALAVSVFLITIGYLLPAIASLSVGADGSAGWRSWESGSFSSVAESLAGPWLQVTVTVGGMFASAAMFSALLTTNSRLPFALAEDGYFPPWLAKRSARRQVPVVSVVGSAAIYALFCLSSFSNLIIVDVFLTNLALLMQVAALLALRVREPDLERPYRIPGGALSLVLITTALTGVTAWAAWQQYMENGTQAVTYCLVAVAGSSLLYFPLARRRKRAAAVAGI
ncbi:APC family permease [Kitasatospora sp. NPDC048538]|uniref:APC family permease n=1 Tax=unclassified Kitasatospora TaxID=2633591 RepID=UPI0033EE9C75